MLGTRSSPPARSLKWAFGLRLFTRFTASFRAADCLGTGPRASAFPAAARLDANPSAHCELSELQ